MSRQYDQRARRNSPARSGLGHWIPLALTVAVATVGIAAWIWSERQDDDEDEGPGGYPVPRQGGPRPDPPGYGPLRPGETAYGTTARPEESSSYMARMSGALKRTPSPQQFIEGASRTVVAGVTAAGAVVGNALSSIREEDKHAYKDHKTWSEEAESRAVGPSSGPQRILSSQGGGKRKTVAVVVSSDADNDGVDDGEDYEELHASILSHLPSNTDFSKIRLFVLIYTPDLKSHPLESTSNRPGSLSSSFSNIGHEQAQTPGEEIEKPVMPGSAATPAFNALWSQAHILVEKETMILPFTSRTGHVHILRHLAPDYVYLQESLAGNNGEVITQLQTWLRQDLVLVVGADGGHGGLVDSESEAEQPEKKVEHWWEREDRVGRGRGIVVVEGLRVGDDWARRIEAKEM